MMNWIDCMRPGNQTHEGITSGFHHAVTIIIATKAYREGRKVYWDRKKEEIVYSPPAYLTA